MNWKIRDFKNLLLKLKSKLTLYHVVLTAQKTSREKLGIIVLEMKLLPGVGKIDSKKILA